MDRLKRRHLLPRLEGLDTMVNQYSNLQPRYLHLPAFFDESPLGNLVILLNTLTIKQFLFRYRNIVCSPVIDVDLQFVGFFFLQNYKCSIFLIQEILRSCISIKFGSDPVHVQLCLISNV